MTFSQSQLENRLAPRPVQFFEQIGSTNDIALKWLARGVASGAVVITNEQVQGRGRLGRSWYTPPGAALIVSVVLRPRPAELSRITMLGAVVICEMLENLGATDVGIKWPNDVHLNGRKVSGVLPEVIWQGESLLGAVLGMGINVCIDFTNTDLSEKAISIEPALGKSVDQLEILVHLLNRIDFWSAHFGTPDLFSAWKKRLNTLGRVVSFESGVRGVAETVNADGALLVRGDDNTLYPVLAGDVALGG